MSPSGPPTPKPVRRFRGEDAALDDIDRRLMHELAADARIPNKALAERVGIAPSTCSTRVHRLRDLGAIRGFHADLAPDALGLPIQAMVAVRLQPNVRASIADFPAKLAKLPGVLNVFFLAGADDFLIHVAAASPDALRDFVAHNLSASRDFASTQTSLIFEHVRSGSG